MMSYDVEPTMLYIYYTHLDTRPCAMITNGHLTITGEDLYLHCVCTSQLQVTSVMACIETWTLRTNVNA